MLVILVAAWAHMAMAVEYTWVGGDGTQTWENATNWDEAGYPDGSDDTAIIGNATADRFITTANALTIGLIPTWTQNDDATNMIVLGGDMYTAGNLQCIQSNDSGNAMNMVIDLNGHTFRRRYTSVAVQDTGGSGYAMITSASGGTWQAGRLYQMPANAVIGAGVIVLGDSTSRDYVNGIWDPTSIYWVTPNGRKDCYEIRAPAGVGHLIIGDTNNAYSTTMSVFRTLTTGRVHGNLTINTYSGATDGDASDLIFNTNMAATWFTKLLVGGNFIDAATDASGYGGNTRGSTGRDSIAFNGSPATARTVSIGRSGLQNDFYVGVDASDTGHIVLEKDLTTSGRFQVNTGSTLDVADKTITLHEVAATTPAQDGAFTVQEGATLAFEVGTLAAGTINCVDLTLGNYTLDLDVNASGPSSDLVLFTYSGTLSSANEPTINITSGAPAQWDAYSTTAGEVKLTNFSVPDTGTCIIIK